MSINKIFDQNNKIAIAGRNILISVFKNLYTNTISREKSIMKESEFFSFLDTVENLDYDHISEFDLLNEEDLQKVENTIKYALNLNGYKSDLLSSEFIAIVNQNKIKLESLISKLKRLKQKKAALDLWDDEYIKYAMSEKFINYDEIGYDLVPSPNLNLNTKQGVLTLPIDKEEVNRISSLRISKGNGFPGNSDHRVSLNNRNLSNIIDSDTNTWFEYERLDSGPVELELTVSLSKEEIINKIEIESYDGDSYFQIKDILFSGSEKDYKSVKSLSVVDNDLYFYPKEIDSGRAWTIDFIPVSAKNILIRLENSDEEYIKIQGNYGISLRKRYSIGLKNILIKKVKYKPFGSINSSVNKLLGSCYVGDCNIRKLPETNKLYNLRIDVSSDGGITWENDTERKTFLIEDSQNFLYKMIVSRKDGAFSDTSSFEDIEETYDLKLIKKIISKNISPVVMSISDKVASNDIFVFQETSLRKTDVKAEAKTFSRVMSLNPQIMNSNLYSSDIYIKKLLPGSFNNIDIAREDIEVFVNNSKWGRVIGEDELIPGEQTYYLNEEERSIYFLKDNLDYRSSITWKIKPDQITFYRRNNGFYGRFKELFNPNKGSITVQYAEGKEEKYFEIIKNTKRRVKLKRKGIIKDSIEIESTNTLSINLAFIRLSSLQDVVKYSSLASPGTKYYYFDEVNSVIYFSGPLDRDDALRISYNCRSTHFLNKDDYDIWFEDGIPKGVIIKEERFVSQDHEQSLYVGGNLTKKIFSLRDKTSRIRENIFPDSKKAFVLDDRSIIRGTLKVSPEIFGITDSLESTIKPIEVDYRNGFSEFLDLETIENEKTNNIMASYNGTVEFTLAAGSYIYDGFPVIFSDTSVFASPVGSLQDVLLVVGNYYISSEGLVRVNVGQGNSLKENISINYSYTNPSSESSYKYSVDYEEGHLYLSKAVELNNGDFVGKVNYKTCNYVGNYDIVIKIDDYTFDKSGVSIDTDYLKNSNSVSVMYKVKNNERTIYELKDYFTPFIDKIDFRFR